MGRSAARSGVGLSVARNAIATTNHAVLDQLNLLSEEELDTACREAGWRGEWREADKTETGGAGQEPSTHQPQVPLQGAPHTLGQGDRQQLAAEDGLGARHSAGQGILAGAVTVSRQVLPASVTDKLETYAGQVLPPDETDKHETFVGQVLPQGGIMDAGRKREAAVVKGVTNQHGSKGEEPKRYREEAQQDKMGWSAHGADGAADVPLPASADGKWAPGEYVVATVVQGWIRAAASKGYRDDGETRPPSV
ncbi:hypothetical protein B484DRAFT_410984, partial [Ochromonadaceae sp. CCMP2298]